MEGRFEGCSVFSHGKINSCRLAIGYFGTKDFKVVGKVCDKKGRILNVDVVLNDTNFLLISFYNSNSEPDKLCTLSAQQKFLKK